MKAAIVFLCLLISAYAVYGGVYGNVITPITPEKLQDSIVKQDVAYILNGSADSYLHEYKVQSKERTIVNKYKNYSWIFSVLLNSDVHKTQKQETFETYCFPDKPLIDIISYTHMRYTLMFEKIALGIINKEIAAVCANKSIAISMKSYISKDRFRNYLHLGIESNSKKMSFIFVIQNSTLYECVLSATQ